MLAVFFNNDKSPLIGITSFLSKEINDGQTVDVSEIKNVDINTGSIDVHVIKGNSEEAVITVQGRATKTFIESLQLNAMSKGDTLEISLDGERKNSLGWGWSNVTLTVELPEKQWNELAVEVNSGDIKVDKLSFDHADLQANSGDIMTDNFSVLTALTVNVHSGDIHVKEYEAEKIDFKVDSGDASFFNGVGELIGSTGSGDIFVHAKDLLNDTTLETGSGDIFIQLDNTPTSLAVDFNTASGDTTMHKDGFTYKNSSSRDEDLRGTFGTGEIKLNVYSGSGDIFMK